jgi:Tol biopolymer transport system component
LVVKRSLLLLLLASVALVPSASSQPGQSPYSCALCLFQVDASGKKQHVVLNLLSLHLAGDSGIALSPDRTRLLYSVPTVYSGDQLVVANIDGTHRRRLAAGVDGSWSPDGSKIAYRGAGGLWVMNANGTGAHRVTADRFDGAVWSPDSRSLAYVSRLGGNGTRRREW